MHKDPKHGVFGGVYARGQVRRGLCKAASLRTSTGPDHYARSGGSCRTKSPVTIREQALQNGRTEIRLPVFLESIARRGEGLVLWDLGLD